APALAAASNPPCGGPARRSRRRPRSPRARSSRHRLNRVDDVLVAGAAADVPFERVPDLVLARARILGQEADRGEHHPARAVAALERVVFVKALLERMERAVVRETLDRRDLAPVR